MIGAKWSSSSRCRYVAFGSCSATPARSWTAESSDAGPRRPRHRGLDLRAGAPTWCAAARVERARPRVRVALQVDALGVGGESVGARTRRAPRGRTPSSVASRRSWRSRPGRRVNVARRRRAPIDSIGPVGRAARLVRATPSVGTRSARRARSVEQVGIAMRRHQQAGATHRVSEADQSTVGRASARPRPRRRRRIASTRPARRRRAVSPWPR